MQKLISPKGENVSASDKAAPILVAEHGYSYLDDLDDDQLADGLAEVTLADRIDAVTTHDQANKLGKELGIEFENKKPGVAAKKQQLHEKAAELADGGADDDLDDLDDDQLAERVHERYPDYDPDAISAAIESRRDEVIADLRANPAE